MKQRSVQITKAVAWLLPLAVMVGGCASAQKKQAAQAAQDQLARAQAAYRQALADPSAQRFAQLPLVDAQKALESAEQAKDVPDIQHLSYAAERKAQTATAIGEARKMEQEIQELYKETSAIVLQRRERELKAVRAEAEARTRDAEQARESADALAREAGQARTEVDQTRLELDTRTREIEQARQDAEARAREVEQARAEAEQARVQLATAQAQASAAQVQTAALNKELTDLKGKQTDRGVVLSMGDVFFSTGKTDITLSAQRNVDKLAQLLNKFPTRNVLIEGHTDNTGPEDVNVALSQKRADAVKNLLVAKGVSPDRITTKGYGLKHPVVSNDTPLGREQNRRVEVIVLNEGATAETAGR